MGKAVGATGELSGISAPKGRLPTPYPGRPPTPYPSSPQIARRAHRLGMHVSSAGDLAILGEAQTPRAPNDAGHKMGFAIVGVSALVRMLPILAISRLMTLRSVSLVIAPSCQMGRAGKIHLNVLSKRDDVKVRWLVDVEPAACPKTSDAVITSELEQALSDPRVSCVIVSTPTPSHGVTIQAALAAGKHVFAEKPLCCDEAEVPALFESAKERGLLLHTAYNRRSDPEIMRARDEIRARKAGAPVGATLVSRDYPYPTPAYLATSGNLFKDCVVHDLDYLTWILDAEVVSLRATASMSDPERACGMWEYSSVHLMLSGGVTANLINARVAPSYDHRLDVYCADGAVRVTNPDDNAVGRKFSDRFAQSYHNQLAAFIEGVVAVGKGAAPEPNVSLERTMLLANLVKACESSVALGGVTIELASDGKAPTALDKPKPAPTPSMPSPVPTAEEILRSLSTDFILRGSGNEPDLVSNNKGCAHFTLDNGLSSAPPPADAAAAVMEQWAIVTTDDSDDADSDKGTVLAETDETAHDDAEKDAEPASLRTYDDSTAACVKELYATMRREQSVEHVQRMRAKYVGPGQLGSVRMSVWDALDLLSTFVDVSDPDMTLPNHIHAFQTAEGLRAMNMPDWLQLTGLIHDLGKMIYLRGSDEDGTSVNAQWSIVGDTWLVGCAMPDALVFPELNAANPDARHPERCTELGIYSEGCGLDNAMCAFGHDEYMYEVLRQSEGVKLPKEALYVIRYHSLYPWHDAGCYARLESNYDRSMKGWVKLFNQHDLYTKKDTLYTNSELAELREYYGKIVDKYLPAELCF